jgi:hypothetical protein
MQQLSFKFEDETEQKKTEIKNEPEQLSLDLNIFVETLGRGVRVEEATPVD